MPTSHNVGQQFQQLAMFHTADYLRRSVHPNDSYGENDDPGDVGMWAEKLDEARWHGGAPEHDGPDTLYESIRSHGVKEPVLLFHGHKTRLADGHHRVAAAASINPKSLVPVLNLSRDYGGRR